MRCTHWVRWSMSDFYRRSLLPPLQDYLGRDPALGQVSVGEQLAQKTSVAAVGLGVAFATTGGLGVGRFGQMGDIAGCSDLLDDVPPAGAALHGQLCGAAVWHRPRS